MRKSTLRTVNAWHSFDVIVGQGKTQHPTSHPPATHANGSTSTQHPAFTASSSLILFRSLTFSSFSFSFFLLDLCRELGAINWKQQQRSWGATPENCTYHGVPSTDIEPDRARSRLDARSSPERLGGRKEKGCAQQGHVGEGDEEVFEFEDGEGDFGGVEEGYCCESYHVRRGSWEKSRQKTALRRVLGC